MELYDVMTELSPSADAPRCPKQRWPKFITRQLLLPWLPRVFLSQSTDMQASADKRIRLRMQSFALVAIPLRHGCKQTCETHRIPAATLRR